MWQRVWRLALAGTASPVTTSVGRLFDAVAALCGVRPEVNYEGQAAIELEAASASAGAGAGAYPMPLDTAADGLLTLDARATIEAVAADVAGGERVGTIASRFHSALAGATVAACARMASEHGTEVVVLSGGVFANRRLLEDVSAGLGAVGLRVLTPELLPAGDGGVSYGQAAVAAAASI
jgi:hydrogenase maturation protein HypF